MTAKFGTGAWEKNYRTNKEIERFSSAITELKRYCPKCGHGVIIISEVDRNLCDYCHHWVYKDETTKKKYEQKEFKINLLRKIKEVEKDER